MKCWANKNNNPAEVKKKTANKSSLAVFGLGHLMVKVFQLVCNLFDFACVCRLVVGVQIANSSLLLINYNLFNEMCRVPATH